MEFTALDPVDISVEKSLMSVENFAALHHFFEFSTDIHSLWMRGLWKTPISLTQRIN